MPEKLMRWNGSQWVEVSLVRVEATGGGSCGLYSVNLKSIEKPSFSIVVPLTRHFTDYLT